MLEVLYHHASFGEAWVSPSAVAAKNVEFFVCLSVRHAYVNAAAARHAARQVAPVVLCDF